jgi:hypothetical protein
MRKNPMSDSSRKRKPGHDHLIPESAQKLRPERHVSTADWKNPKSYINYKKWTLEQWAWEFLRRNKFFQKDCDAFEASRERNKKLPSQWQLHTFKSYSEPFKGKELQSPKWSIFSQVEIWDTNTPLRLKQPRRPWHVDDLVLRPGQVALVLDLNDANAMPSLLHAQWTSAWYKLALSARRLKTDETKKAGGVADTSSSAMDLRPSKRLSLPRTDKLIDYLRIADAFSLNYPASLEEVCIQLHADGRLQASATAEQSQKTSSPLVMVSAKNSLYKMIEASRRVIYDRGYLLLLAEEARKATWKDMVASYWPQVEAPTGRKKKSTEPDIWGQSKEEAVSLDSYFSGIPRQKRD